MIDFVVKTALETRSALLQICNNLVSTYSRMTTISCAVLMSITPPYRERGMRCVGPWFFHQSLSYENLWPIPNSSAVPMSPATLCAKLREMQCLSIRQSSGPVHNWCNFKVKLDEEIERCLEKVPQRAPQTYLDHMAEQSKE